MTSVPPHSPSGQSNPTWREVDELVDAVAGLSTSDLSPPEFYAQLMDRIVPALAALRSSRSAARKRVVAAAASPLSTATRNSLTAERARLLTARFRSRRFGVCRARLAADLWLAMGREP